MQDIFPVLEKLDFTEKFNMNVNSQKKVCTDVINARAIPIESPLFLVRKLREVVADLDTHFYQLK